MTTRAKQLAKLLERLHENSSRRETDIDPDDCARDDCELFRIVARLDQTLRRFDLLEEGE